MYTYIKTSVYFLKAQRSTRHASHYHMSAS